MNSTTKHATDAQRRKAFSATRISAVVLVALAALGLVYLHLTTRSTSVSVPAGAHAGQLQLHPCSYDTEDGSYAADCGTLVVREDRHDAHSRLIALPVKRIHARSAHPGMPIFRLAGGPGITNMDFPQASRVADTHDVVLVGYRGVDGSSKLDCPEVTAARAHAREFLTQKSMRDDAAAFGACAHRLRREGVDLAGYTLPERVDDLDAARRALGYQRIDLLSESAGTRTALIYAWRYPKRIHRSVMIGVNPPGRSLWDAKTTGEQIRRYAALCASDASCRTRTPDLTASIHSAFTHVPSRWWFLPVKQGNVKVGAFFGLMNATTDAAGPLAGPWTIDWLLSSANGDAAGAWFMSVMTQLVFPHAQVWGEVAAFGRSDASFARRFFAGHADRGSAIGAPGTDFVWAGKRLLDAWPASPDEREYTSVRDSSVDTLLIGGALDFATPPQNATRDLLPHLSKGRQVVLPNLGHSDDFWAYEPAAGTRLINRYFDTGRVDTSLYTPSRLDFTPAVGVTWIAKIVLIVMLAFAGLTALSLVWMPLRVRSRGAFGRKASGALRSVYPILLGLGGWFAAALVVLTAFPTVPLDDELLAALSIGLPIGLAVYLSWMHRDWSVQTKAIGLTAAAAGAVVGGWLGFNVLEGLVAVLTTVAGAVVGANATLLALDVAWDLQARDRTATSTVEGAPRRTERRNSMSAPRHSNLAARMGRWSANHWKTAVFGWLAFVVVAFGLGSAVGTKKVDQSAAGPGESGRMQKILDAGFEQPAGEIVLIQSRSARVGDSAFTAAIRDVVDGVSKEPAVQNVRRGAISKDGHNALVEFDIRGDKTDAVDKIAPVLDRVAAAQRANPTFFIGEFGDASGEKGVETAYEDDLGKAGTLSLPVTIVILVLAFGALVAAGIPLLLGLTAVIATFGLIAIPSHLLPVAFQAYAMVLLIGLAVGVDYSMFYLKRERQERAAGRSPRAALEAAAATSGRSVLVSGLTVIVAMAGMFLTADATFASLAVATILVVAVAVVGSLTVLPALLSKLGDNVDRLHVPLVRRLRRDDGEGRVWSAIVDRVLRRPALSALVAAGLLVALAVPALQLRLAPSGPAAFPQSLRVIKTYNRMQAAFPGKALPAEVVFRVPNVHAPDVRAAIADVEKRALASGRMFEPITMTVNKDATVGDITIPIAGNGMDAASNAAFHELRDVIVPETLGTLPEAEAGVTGLTASWKDQATEFKSNLPPVVAFVLLFAFGLMLFAFRSIVVAIKAIVLNLLSVAAAYGVLVLVFQHGIGFSSTDGIDSVVPLLLFVILFGLSMDYHVFILSRIRETWDRGASMDDAIAHGIKSTAGVVTSAAIVMVCVFSVFATLSMTFFQQFGVGLAAAILIDATVVRAVLLPATMKLLGKANWYLPSWLEWLPRTEPEEPAPPEATPAPVL